MSADRTVLEHLMDGRAALVVEISRLTTAIGELDAVIDRLGGSTVTVGSQTGPGSPASEPVNAAPEVEPAPPVRPARRQTRSTTRPSKSAPAKRASGRSGAASGGQKSIRVRVLEMLAAEDRDFGLAEIIDRIHAEGIAAHDDAVRSITIKLMKDGRVERVGRGMYRLAGRRSAAASGTPAGSADARATAPAAGQSDPSTPAGEQPAEIAPENYVPPLNLSQPWEHR